MIKGQTLGINSKQSLAGGAVQSRGIVNGKQGFVAHGLVFVRKEHSKFGACPTALEQNAQKALFDFLGFGKGQKLGISGNPVQGRKQGMTDRYLKVLSLVSLSHGKQSLDHAFVLLGCNSTEGDRRKRNHPGRRVLQ